MNSKLRSIVVVWGMVFTCTIIANAAIKKGPYLLYPGNNTQMTVLWQLDGTQSCTLEWGETTSYSDGSTGTSEYGSDHQHKYTITGLTVNTKYYYRVTVGASQYTGSFRAAPSNSATSVKFLAYGDTRTYPADHDTVCEAMVDAFVDDANYQSFTLLAGDWVNAGENETDWTNQYFNRSYSNALEMMASLPINGCIGNHEWDSGSSPPTYYDKYWPYPYVNGFYWSFDYGPVHVAVIDQYDESYSTGSAQHNWLINDLANTTKEWKILQFHEPGYSAGGHGNSSSVQSYIQPLCETYDVDIVFAGHNHYYARCDRNGVKHITTGGGGAPLYAPDPGYPYLEAYSQNYHYCKIDIDGKQLDFEAVKPNGTVIDSFTLSHELYAQIDSPAADSNECYGEPVSFEGSASGGVLPYSYSWSSDVDGALGTGSTLVVSDLGVHRVGSSVEPHTITLTVEDDNSDIDTAQIDLTILFKGDFEPDGDVDFNDYAVFADDWLYSVGDIEGPTPTSAWWKFDEESGSSAADSSVNNNTGTLYNMNDSDWIAGKFGNALDFDGSNDYVKVNDHASISFGTGSFSLSLWIKTTDTGTRRILINGTSGPSPETGCRYDIRYQGGKVYFVIDDDTTKTWLYSPNAVWGSGEWVHVVAVRNRTTDRMYLYRDSEPDCDKSDDTNNSIDSPGEPLLIGSGEEGEEHFPGAIDDVRFYNYALSEDDIDDLYNSGPGVADSPANLNDDEIVDYEDLDIMLEDWLEVGY